MKYIFLLLLSLSTTCFASTAGFESDRIPSVIWQGKDGKYYVQTLENDDEGKVYSHVYVFDDLIHAEICPCDLNTNYKIQ